MAHLYQTTGIVLSRRDHREVDRWYSVFTPDKGKVEFLARGGHKPLAKLTPHLEMVAEVELLIVVGRYYQTVAGVERRRAFSGLYERMDAFVLAQNALHLVDIGTRPHEQDARLYTLLLSWLAFLEKAPELGARRAGFLTGAFALKLLSQIGYQPELYRCLDCQGALEPMGLRWHALRGGVVCQRCVLKDERQWFAARPIDDSTLKLLRFALRGQFQDQLRVRLSIKDLSHFHEAIESLLISHFPTIPASSLRAACAVC